IEVGESVKQPVAFYDNNVIGSLNLLSSAIDAGVNAFVFSSTCATYGLPEQVPIDETHRQAPINPYGRTKWVVEQALKDYSAYKGLRSVMLRYFNAAGA
ncbi:UDP-glucose 4-epimerase, partial [bacterium M00.F.Ca.ET.163.01.1.1]